MYSKGRAVASSKRRKMKSFKHGSQLYLAVSIPSLSQWLDRSSDKVATMTIMLNGIPRLEIVYTRYLWGIMKAVISSAVSSGDAKSVLCRPSSHL